MRKADTQKECVQKGKEKDMIMATILFANKLYSERYGYAVLKEKEQSFKAARSYKAKNGKCIVVDIG